MRHPMLAACCLGLAMAANWCSFAAPAASQADAILLPDGGRYTGPLLDGVRQGSGTVEWSNGARYDLGFAAGLYSGTGTLRFADGDVYQGDFARGMQSGQGRLVFRDGGVYSGEFRDGAMAGRGRYESANGTVYEGQFEASQFHGQGRLASPAGEYIGEFRRGAMAGQGEMRFKDGRVYSGGFAAGDFHGKGRLEYASGPVYEGDFLEGGFTGEGVVHWPGGIKHEGRFRNWRPEGPGAFSDGYGNVYGGTFENGELKGSALVTMPDGSRYQGETSNRMFHGQGKLQLANGDVYQGGFEFGVYQGEGELIYAKAQPDGRTRDSGLWFAGRLKKEVEEERRLARANAEIALYKQPALLADALRGIAPRNADGINLYLLAVAGDGSQEVFRREVEFVRKQFDADFGTRGRSLTLINSRTTAGSVPMASVTSIRQAVGALATAMDKERDILFLYVTSHGSKDAGINLGLTGMELPALEPRELAALLKDAGIRWKVIVLSACYAGGFIEELRDPQTLVMTAARHDRRSFGCADENEFTYFGRAYFKEALPQSASFEEAFSTAAGLIAEWEDRDARQNRTDGAGDAKRDEERHSMPQIAGSPAIREQLRKWREQLATARRNAQSAAVMAR